MADLSEVKYKGDKYSATFEISKDEYKLLKNEIKDFIIVPVKSELINEMLTSGDLGNSKRLMLKKKYLARHNVTLEKKVPGKFFEINDKVFLLVKLKGK